VALLARTLRIVLTPVKLCDDSVTAFLLTSQNEEVLFLKVVYPVCCGVDVHKTFLVGTIISTTVGIQPHYQKRRFSTHNGDIRAFKDWLQLNRCLDVCMESTGKYWVPVFNILDEHGIRVAIANPKWVKAVKGNKDDNKDSKWIGDLFRLGLVPGSFIPPKPIRLLREFTRYRAKLVSMKSSEKNRFQNAFTVCNVALDSVVSDMFGKSASAITDYLMSDEVFNSEHCVSLLQRSLKKKADAVLESVDGFSISPEQKVRMRIVREHLAYIEACIADVDKQIQSMVTQYDSQIELLCTIPGVDRNSAITIISEIGTDMDQFGSSRRLCCWAGLTPGNNESAGKKKSVRITRAGVYLKPALVQAAHAAVKSNDSPYYRLKYEQIARRRGKKRAIIAIARMILTAIFAMLSTGEVFNPSDLYKVDMPETLKNKQREKALKQAIRLIESQGLSVG
jgi:transposase